MHFYTAFFAKSTLTLRTGIWQFLLRVLSHVHFQSIDSSKRLSTYCADLWPLAAVDAHVLLKIILLIELQTTFFTLEGFHTCVRSLMPLRIPFLMEGFGAVRTLVRFVIGMPINMSLEILFVVECLVAMLALHQLYSNAMNSHVRGEVA